MPTSVEDYVAGLTGWQAEAAAKLRKIIARASPDLTEGIKWSQPVYECNGPVCWFKAFRNHVSLGFWRGVELTELEPRLESSGSKMAHRKFASAADIRERELAGLIRAAVRLNLEKGSPNRRKAAAKARAKQVAGAGRE